MARKRRLLIRMTDGTVHDCEIVSGAPFIVGRGREAHLRIDLKSVSRQHCKLEVDEASAGLSLVDMGSQNGTLLNGKRVERASLRSGDRIQCGVTAFDVEFGEAGESSSSHSRLKARAQGVLAGAPPAANDEIAQALAQMGLEPKERVDLGSPVPVYRARRADLEQEVRVKAVRVEDEEHASRLLREAKLAARVRHPGIVQVFDVRRSHGIVAIVYEWVEGRILATTISKEGRVDPVRALDIGAQICAALAHAHSLGVIHRNITPAAIVLTTYGEAKIVDFGLAKGIAESTRGEALTAAGKGLGAVEYAPPEQVRDAATVDHRADIYAVGSTLYHALAGEPPLVQVSPHAPDDPSADVPAPLESVAPELPRAAIEVVDRAMAREPDDRYANALMMQRALEAARGALAADLEEDDHGTALISVSPDGEAAPVSRRMPAPTPGSALSAAGAVSGPTTFTGRIRIDELVEILQMVEHNRKSGTLQIFGSADAAGKRLTGTIVFRDGRIVGARAAERRGSEALLELLLLRAGDFSVVYGEPPASDVDAGLPPLAISATLMDVLRRRDESRKRRPGS